MSVSIHENPADEHEGADESARSVLAGWLDDYAAGRCERADMEESFMSVCRNDPEAPWDALALLDQYQRLGRIEADLARDLKSQIAQLAVGAPGQKEDRASKGPSNKQGLSENPALVGSQTRWRKPAAEHDSESLNTDDIEVPPTAIRNAPSAPAAPLHRAHHIDHEVDHEDDEPHVEDDADDEAADPEEMPSESLLRQPSPFARKAAEVHRAHRAPPRRVAPPAPGIEGRQRSTTTRPPASAPVSAKRVLRDRYELLSVLARGNSSTVYKALDRHRANLSESARYVAIKVLDADFDAKPEALAELEREFHQAQSLSHPNIASVFDLDRDGSTYFMVMELLEGDLLTSILRRLDNRPMTRNNALALIGSIGAALAHAHRRDIAHGDLKPRNIMITSMGEVRVLEFGFAHSRTLQAGDVDPGHEAVSIGTHAYASAERVHGFEPDPSDDVYSLACISYELLSGRHPYGGRSALLARAHGKRPQRIAGLNHRQWHALQRALAWDRAERKIDVVDLLAALGTSNAPKEPVPPELLSIPEDLRAQRRRIWALVATIVGVVALVTYLVTRVPPPVQNADLSAVAPAPEPSAETAPVQTAPQREETPSEEVVSPAENTAAVASRPAGAQTQTVAPRETPTDALTGNASTRPQASAPPPASSGSVQFTKDTFVVTEGESAVSLDVSRTGSARGELAFRWTVRSNSAETGSDFAAIGPGIERIPAGTRSATILIPLVSDSLVENTELFLVELEPIDEGVKIGELGHAAVIIVDDD